jgi:sensor histidine kinase YesM
VFTGFSQGPNHYFLGDDFFAGVKIYDLIQDDQEDYWMVTDQGLFSYDGYKFVYVDDELISGSSLFNLRKDEQGVVYFNDLKNRFYTIQDQEVNLFYELNEDETHHNVFLETFGDRLYIQAENLILIDQDGERSLNYDISSGKARNSLYVLPDGSTVATTLKHTIVQRNETVNIIETDQLEDGKIPGPTAWITINDNVFAVDQNSMNLYEFDTDNSSYTLMKSLNQELVGTALRVYAAHDQIWLVGSRNGVFTYDQNWNALNQGQPILADYFISDVYTDVEGNVLCSTFDEGIIVVPSLDFHRKEFHTDVKLMDASVHSDSSLFLGTNDGALLYLDLSSGTQKEVYRSLNGEAVDFVNYFAEQDVLLFATPKGFAIARFTPNGINVLAEFTGAIKAASSWGDKCLVAMNIGVYELDLTTYALSPIEGLNDRAFDMITDQETGTLYASMTDGLKVKKMNEGEISFVWNEKPVYSTAVVGNGENVFVGCNNGEMLVFQNDEVLEVIDFFSPIKSVELGADFLFIKTLSTNYLYDIQTGSKTPLVTSMGFDNNEIRRIEFTDELLVLLEEEAVTWLNTDLLSATTPSLPVQISSFTYNGNPTNQRTFPYANATFTFNFEVSTLTYQNNVTYQYRLLGFDAAWKELTYDQSSVAFNSLAPGSYEFVVKSVNGEVESKEVTYSFEVEAPYYQQWWFYLLILLFIVFIFYLFYRYRIGVLRKKNEEVVEKQKLATDLLEMELKALRSQMNPHFIFNSLNSIQSLVLKEDIDNSYDYLVLFAKLVRSTLNYSDLNFIPIEKEIEFLNIYLSLEKLRFKRDFAYEIVFDEDKDFHVPPLIIQPFIENALVHGLLHKEGEKRLTIKFSRGEYLTCEIEDNGVGRSYANEINERTKLSEHKSFAMKAIQQRLDLLNKHVGDDIGGFEVVDLLDNGKPAGTRVILKLPIQSSY